jgi:hypothetical protein
MSTGTDSAAESSQVGHNVTSLRIPAYLRGSTVDPNNRSWVNAASNAASSAYMQDLRGRKQHGGAVSLNLVTRSAGITGVIAVAGIIAGCTHTTTFTPSGANSGASPAATSAAPIPATEPGVTTYLCTFSNEDMLLQWSTSNGYLSGAYQDAGISGTAPQEQVNTGQGHLGGTTSSSGGITLNIETATWYGSISGSSVTLNVPQDNGSIQPVSCNQATVSDWNNAVGQLEGQVTSDNTIAFQQQAQASSAAAQQQAQQQQAQQVSNAQQSLSSDISTLESDATTLNNDTTLAGDISTMKSDYGIEQSDYQTEQSASCPTASGDAGTVSADGATVGSDLSTLNSDIQVLKGSSDVGGIQSDIAAVKNDVSTLQNLGASPSKDPSSALAAGNKAISNANAAIGWANQQGSAIDGEAQHLATAALNWASQHGC